MKRTLALLAALLGSLVPLCAQPADAPYTLTAYVSGGYALNVSQFEIEPPGLARSGFGFTGRIMWKPEHLLSVGLESGRTHVYSVDEKGLQTNYGQTDANLTLNATPVLVVFSMSPIEHVDVCIGGGPVFLSSDLEAFGSDVAISSTSGGAMAAVSYFHPLDETWRIGAEVKGLYMEKFDDAVLSIQVMVAYKFLEW